MELDIFAQATKMKLTFQHKGTIGVEDLWDLSLESLNSIYKALAVLARQSNEDGLLTTRKSEDKVLALKLQVVKAIFESKSEELETRKNAAEKRQKKEKLKEILELRQQKELLDMSAEDIQKLINDIE